MKTDVVIVGAGPAGIFTALEMIRKGSRLHLRLSDGGADCTVESVKEETEA